MSRRQDAQKVRVGVVRFEHRGELAARYGRWRRRRIEALRQQARASGARRFADFATYAHALLANGLGDHEGARDAARELFLRDPPGIRVLTISELIEAASRTSEPELMASAPEWLSDHARTTSTGWLAGLHTRAQALATAGDAADALFRTSPGHLARLELARGHLLYGEWLRRQRQPADARSHLRTAYDMFTATGAMGFAGRELEIRPRSQLDCALRAD